MMRGQNLASFTDAQLEFAAHIRNPELNPRPRDVEQRRMDIYVGLFYRNIESFIVSAFPVLKSCLETRVWDDLVREFVHRHASESPYFLEISQEFLTFLDQRGLAGLPVFTLELAHYEWVELALDVAPAQVTASLFEVAEIGTASFSVSPLALPLTYQFDVHKIGPEHQPAGADRQGCFLIGVRDELDQVKFIESNPLTHRLLDLINESSVHVVTEQLYEELSEHGAQLDAKDFAAQVEAILLRLAGQRVLICNVTNEQSDED